MGGSTAMTPSADSDLAQLSDRAFGVADWVRLLLQRYHRVIGTLCADDAARLQHLHAWVLCPPSLWPMDFPKLLSSVMDWLEAKKPLSDTLLVLLDLLPQAPGKEVIAVVAAHEKEVQQGSYEQVLQTQAKFAQAEADLLSDAEFQHQWLALKQGFALERYRDYKGILRRTMLVERNLRCSPVVQVEDEASVFQAAFDAFCMRWHLYGMMGDQPLLLKLSVNLTAFGTMIHIPAYWSFDPKRDIRWDAIARLHRARVPARQGARLAQGKTERRELARRLRKLDAQAASRGLTGQAKHEFLCAGLGWVLETSPRRISRLRTEFQG